MPQLKFRPDRFIIWYFIETPKNIFTTLKRFIVILNNEISFTLNIHLLFTPLFGDYTLIGHLTGFCIRSIQILAGFLLMVIMIFSSLLLPILWIFLPIVTALIYIPFTILGVLLLYGIWYVSNLNTPTKRLKQLKDEEFSYDSVRPNAIPYIKALRRNWSTGINKLIKSEPINALLIRSELDISEFYSDLSSQSADIDKVKDNSYKMAKEHESRYIEIEHIFTAAVNSIDNIDHILVTYNSNLETLNNTCAWIIKRREEKAKRYIWQPEYELMYVGGIGKGMTGVITPALDAVSTDFTKMAEKGQLKRIIGHKDKMKEIADMLKGSKNNILIIGPAGSGKTSLVKGIANAIIEGTQYKTLYNKRIVSLELSGLLSGTTTSGQVAEKINKVINEIKRSRDIILFIDEIHTIVTGLDNTTAETSTIFSILEPIIADEKIQIIGATTIKNYRKFIEPNGAFSRLFQIVEINQTSSEETLEILKENSERLETKHNITITLPALNETIKLSDKLIQERVHPDKALDILERTATKISDENSILDRNAVEKVISEITHVPVQAVTEDEANKLLKIDDVMKEMVIGQDHALKQISSALKRARVGIRNESKPIASFLFAGTTGVGKTQTAKALAKSYFGDQKNMIRLDMSEYQNPDSINRLLGSPDGSIRGYLTDRVREKPFSLILLDEIEKAHSNILLTFLQVLDEGHITDAEGNSVNFTNNIIIATSNVGTRVIQSLHEENRPYDEIKEKALIEIRNHFVPEFLNRFSGIIIYRPLDKESIRKICLMLLDKVKLLAKEKGVELTFKDDLIQELINRGFSPEWGARPLERTIEDSVESYLATKLLTKEIKEGDSVELGLEVFEIE